MNKLLIKICFGCMVIIFSCQAKPEVLKPVNSTPFSSQIIAEDPEMRIREVLIEDVLQGNKYSYLSVSEGEDPFWIAISKTEVEKGKRYSYRGGLLMRNFESKEFNRVFDTIYLVSAISPKTEPGGGSPNERLLAQAPGAINSQIQKQKIEVAPGGIQLAELFSNKEKYGGQIVRIKGKITKINRNIMGKNWIHLNDGSLDDKEQDLTVTTQDVLSVGDIVIMEGKISLNMNFGAGYIYEIIMEEASMVL